MPAIRTVPFDRSYRIPDRAGVYQSVMCDVKRDRGVTLQRVTPVVNGITDVARSFWLDWETEVEILPRPAYVEEIPEPRK